MELNRDRVGPCNGVESRSDPGSEMSEYTIHILNQARRKDPNRRLGSVRSYVGYQ